VTYLAKGLKTPDKIAITDQAGTWTYGELAQAMAQVAGSLLGTRRSLEGERVGMILEPSRESIGALLGVLAAGGVAVPIATQAAPAEIAYEVEDSGATRLIANDSFQSKLASAFAGSESRPGLLGMQDLFRSTTRDPSPLQGEAPAMMLYTSGTTGRPKGVLHTHGSVQNQVEVLRGAWRWQADDHLLHILPLHHVHGLINGALGALWAGASLRFLPRFDATTVWQAFVGETSVFFAVPTIYHQLLERWDKEDKATQKEWIRGAQRLRLAVSGSAALPAPVWHRWQYVTGQALLERYGMTEIGMALSNPYEGERRPGMVGMALPTMDVRIVTEEGRDAGAEEPGEIWVRGPSLFREYWQRPEATAESFRDGYFLTGDIAQTEDGYVRILGRASTDIIKSGGYKLSALEIEAALADHPAIDEIAVVGAEDLEWGEIVTACIVLRPGQSLTLEALRAWCTEKLSPYKHPRRLELYESLPRNAMGKVTKTELRDGLARK
jgi:malonyl-CoA/methylmalonyl-CoA synthetase